MGANPLAPHHSWGALRDAPHLCLGTDLTFVQKVHAQLGSHSHLARPRFAPDAFIVRHYAQDVTYNGAGFLDKNRDTITGPIAQTRVLAPSHLRQSRGSSMLRHSGR